MTDKKIITLMRSSPENGLEEAVLLYSAYVLKICRIKLSGKCNEEDIEDMTQDCAISLMQAVETYDEKKARFNTHAYGRVQFAILAWLKKNHIIHKCNSKFRSSSMQWQNFYKTRTI